MTRRNIIEIDESKCDGCGQCVPACAEGAIRIVDGKARLVADVYCDGLGACLGECPRNAIRVIEREAQPFDESLADRNLPVGQTFLSAKSSQHSHHGCPGAAMRDLRLNVLPTVANHRPPAPAEPTDASALAHWPIQLRLVPPNAPFLRQADLYLVADCVPFACADFHAQILRGRPIVIGCPKLDDAQAYVDKLAKMLIESEIRSLTVAHMEVPCCTNLLRIAGEAVRRAGSAIPLHDITVSIGGQILNEKGDKSSF